jgi:hypothetical protein
MVVSSVVLAGLLVSLPAANAAGTGKFTVWVFKDSGGVWVQDSGRTFNTDDVDAANDYMRKVKAIAGWMAASNVPEPPALPPALPPAPPTGIVGKPARAGILEVRNHVKLLTLNISIGRKNIGKIGPAVDDTTPTNKKFNIDLTDEGNTVTVVAEVAPGQIFAGQKWTRTLDGTKPLTMDVIPFKND